MTLTMHDYITAIPDAVRLNLRQREAVSGPLAEHFVVSGCRRIVLVASGSSYNAVLCALEGMRANLKLPVELITPFYYEYYFRPEPADYLIFVSQSGYSSNMVSAMRKAKEQQAVSVCVTGHMESDLAGEAEQSFDYGLGEEAVGYVTKGVALLAVYFWMFAAEVGKCLGRIDAAEYDRWYEQLHLAADSAKVITRRAGQCFEKFEKDYLSMDRAILCGAGCGLGTAAEGALKISETVRISCIVCDPEELLHGYYYPIDPGYTVFLVSDRPETEGRVNQIARALREVTERVYIIKNGLEDGEVKTIASGHTVDWRVSPLAQLSFFQEIAYLASSRLNSYALHPLAANMKKWVRAKTENYRKDQKE